MDFLDILSREHELIRKEISALEEMTYSPSVNTRDFSELFNRLSRLWDIHEQKDETLFKILSLNGYKVFIEDMKFNKGTLFSYKKAILEALESGNEEIIKRVLKTTCCNLIDLLKAHAFSEEMLLENVSWNELDEETKQKIRLIQVIPSEELLE
jgi:hypothetical protein